MSGTCCVDPIDPLERQVGNYIGRAKQERGGPGQKTGEIPARCEQPRFVEALVKPNQPEADGKMAQRPEGSRETSFELCEAVAALDSERI